MVKTAGAKKRRIRYSVNQYQYLDSDKARKILGYVARDMNTILAAYLQDVVVLKGAA